MNILIKGGEFNNKGAEAMSLISIYNIKKILPNANIFFYSSKLSSPFDGDLKINYFFLPTYFLYYKIGLINKKKYFFSKLKNFVKKFIPCKCYYPSSLVESGLKIIKEADYLIDISGLALSSKWGKESCVYYISWIDFVKKFNPDCKIYLMPQSFGPFDLDETTNNKIKNSLAKCEKIFAREQGGYKALTEDFGLKNIVKSYDSVLIEKEYSPEKVISNIDKYVEKPQKVEGRKIAIIPNYRLIDRGNNSIDSLIALYSKIINQANVSITFYLIPHAGEDIQICRMIKKRFADDSRVVFIDHVMASFNYESFISDFDYIIASRYHSIVHAYRGGTPAIIIGWSEKYDEIAKTFDQSDYIYDLKGDVEIMDLINKIESNYLHEREHISSLLPDIQKHSCYEFLQRNT